MRCASPAAESLFSDGQHFRSSGSSRATNGGGADEAAFNQSVRSVFAGALKQVGDLADVPMARIPIGKMALAQRCSASCTCRP